MSNANNQPTAGSYAVTTVYSMPWTKKAPTTAKPKRKKVEKKVVHRIFEKCAELTEDNYWISIFQECARDKFPRGFSYKNRLMTYRRGNKIIRLQIPNNPTEAFSTCISFFKSSAGLMSATDQKRIQKEEEDRLLESILNSQLAWKDIRSERVKELLISEYVSDLSKKHKYTFDQKKELLTVVKSGFMLKYFTGKNITMEDGKIVNILGLIYDEKNNNYHIDPKYTKKRPGRKVKGLGIEKCYKKPKVSFLANWEKYLQSMEKKQKIISHAEDSLKIIEPDNSSGDLYVVHSSTPNTNSPNTYNSS